MGFYQASYSISEGILNLASNAKRSTQFLFYSLISFYSGESILLILFSMEGGDSPHKFSRGMLKMHELGAETLGSV
jgi:hypothetical protein